MISTFLAAAALSAIVPVAVTGQGVPATAHVHVHVADLDLTSPSGVQTLDQRIRHAAAAICPSDGNVELARKLDMIACREAMFAMVKAQRDQAIARAQAHRTALASNVTRAVAAGD
jgi:UrcA family protein